MAPSIIESDVALSGKRITLGVSGSIAAYKAADLVSRLVKLGADVHVILTRAGAQFVGPATFRALTQNPVLTSLFDEPLEGKIAHIALGQETDLIVVGPATANVIAKMAHGLADDLLSSTLLAATVPVIVAPAMNTAMLDHPATVQNLRVLADRGVTVVNPSFGRLVCKTEGPGKLAEIEDILEAILGAIGRKRELAKVRVTVTAGPTREPLDPVRFLSNRSSGKMGYALAEAARDRGARVTLISGPTALTSPAGVQLINVTTTREMLDASRKAFPESDLFISAAAPADYTPVDALKQKLKKSGDEWSVRLKETPDILTAMVETKGDQVMIGFAAETESLAENAIEKLQRKKLDLIVGNDVTAEGAGFEVDTNVVTLFWPDGRQDKLPKLTKREVANRILDAALPLLGFPVK